MPGTFKEGYIMMEAVGSIYKCYVRRKDCCMYYIRSLDLVVALTDGVVYTINGNTAFMNLFVHKSSAMVSACDIQSTENSKRLEKVSKGWST